MVLWSEIAKLSTQGIFIPETTSWFNVKQSYLHFSLDSPLYSSLPVQRIIVNLHYCYLGVILLINIICCVWSIIFWLCVRFNKFLPQSDSYSNRTERYKHGVLGCKILGETLYFVLGNVRYHGCNIEDAK